MIIFVAMRITWLFTFLLIMASCSNDADNTLDRFSTKVDELEEKSAVMDNQAPEIQQLVQDLNSVMAEISAMQFTDKQQTRLTGIALKLQVVSMSMQSNTEEKIKTSIDSIERNLDINEIYINSSDTGTLNEK